jgi:hypothetical protein
VHALTVHMIPFAFVVLLFAHAHVGSCHDEFGVPTYPSSVPAFDQLSAPVGPPVFIHGGVIVNADGQVAADVLLENGIVVAVGSSLHPPPNAINIDASGKYVLVHAIPISRVVTCSCRYVMPGGIEPHTHLEMPFMGQEACDDFFSGQAAALAGGTTMHIDFALPLNGSIEQGYHIYRKKAEKSCMDYGFHMAVTQWNSDVEAEMEFAVKHGINSFKFFMAYKGALMVNDEQLARGMYRCKELGALPMVHAENGDMVALGQEMIFAQGIHGPEGHALSRPDILEIEATGRAVRISEIVGTPLYVVHVQSKGAAEEIAAGNARGARVIGEVTCPQLQKQQPNLALIFCPANLARTRSGRVAFVGQELDQSRSLCYVPAHSQAGSRWRCIAACARLWSAAPRRHRPRRVQLHPKSCRSRRFQENSQRCQRHRGAHACHVGAHGQFRLDVAVGFCSSHFHCRRQDIQHLPSQRNHLRRVRRRRHPSRSHRPTHSVCCHAPFQSRHERV